MRVKPEDVGSALGSIVLPAAGVRGLVVVLVAVVLAAPWLATWAGLLQVDDGAGVGATREVVRLRPELVLLPGGRFMMGSPEGEDGRDADEVLHEVELSPFLMCRTAVTNEQWKAVMGNSPSDCTFGCEDNQSVQSVTWEQTTAYLNALTDRENMLFPVDPPLTRCYEGDRNTTWADGCTGYRLPSEAEWEYAAWAGTKTADSFVQNPSKPGESVAFMEPKNRWGLNDMQKGWEWVWDRFDGRYSDKDKVTKDPGDPENRDSRVLRGPSLGNEPWRTGSADRSGGGPTYAYEALGFRCARASHPVLGN